MFSFSPFQSGKFQLPSLAYTAFFFDFDSVLIPLSSVQHDFSTHTGQELDWLRDLRHLCGDALAVISRFPIKYVDEYMKDVPFAVIGENGDVMRFRPGEEIEKESVPIFPPFLMSQIRKTISQMPGVFLEHIEGGILLRYIAAPEYAHDLYELAKGWTNQTKGKFEVNPEPMAWRISPVGIDRGIGIRRVMENTPFKGRRPVFVGKTTNNDSVLEMLPQLQGVGLCVPTDFPTFATFWSWLGALIEKAHKKEQNPSFMSQEELS